MKTIHPIALFRLSVLGPLASRERLEHGELKRLIRHLSIQVYSSPSGQPIRIAEKTASHIGIIGGNKAGSRCWYRRSEAITDKPSYPVLFNKPSFK